MRKRRLTLDAKKVSPKRFLNDICEILRKFYARRRSKDGSEYQFKVFYSKSIYRNVHISPGHIIPCETVKLKSIDSKPCNHTDGCVYENRTILRWIFVRRVVVTRYTLLILPFKISKVPTIYPGRIGSFHTEQKAIERFIRSLLPSVQIRLIRQPQCAVRLIRPLPCIRRTLHNQNHLISKNQILHLDRN